MHALPKDSNAFQTNESGRQLPTVKVIKQTVFLDSIYKKIWHEKNEKRGNNINRNIKSFRLIAELYQEVMHEQNRREERYRHWKEKIRTENEIALAATTRKTTQF